MSEEKKFIVVCVNTSGVTSLCKVGAISTGNFEMTEAEAIERTERHGPFNYRIYEVTQRKIETRKVVV